MTTNIPGPAPLGDKLRIAFLGPFGTFTEQAVHQVAPAGAILMPMTSAPQALAAVRRGEADRAVVPIENSIEGGVNATLDSLSHGEPLVIVAEMHVHVVFQLAVLPGTRPEDIRRIGTHPHAWAQCRGWVEETFPGAIHVPATSTAAAAELLSDGDASFDAALCNAVSVNTYGLEALFTDVADNPGAITRFVLVARPGAVPPPTGADKTTIQVALPVNESGALLTLVGLHRYSPEVRFMGSYPRVDGVRARVEPGTTDDAFRAGRAWVSDLLHGGDGTGEAGGAAPCWPLV